MRCILGVARDISSLDNGLWGNRSPGVVTIAREIARVARGISGVVLGDSRLDGGATPAPGKEELVCTLMSMETDLSQQEEIHKVCSFIVCSLICSSCVDNHIYVHIIFVLIHSQYVFAFVERPWSEPQ